MGLLKVQINQGWNLKNISQWDVSFFLNPSIVHAVLTQVANALKESVSHLVPGGWKQGRIYLLNQIHNQKQ